MKNLAPTLSALAVVFAISAMQADDLGAEQAMADAHQAARHEALAQARLHQAQVALCVSVAGVGSTPVELEDGSFVCTDSTGRQREPGPTPRTKANAKANPQPGTTPSADSPATTRVAWL